MAPARTVRWLAIVASALLAAMLIGCGVKYATVRTDKGEDLMLLGHDPVAYFTVGKPVRGHPNLQAQFRGVTYYFASEDHRKLFVAEPAKYEPQYGGFCADGAAYGVKLGSDPTEFAIYQGRLFIFGDVVGREFWKLRPAWDVEKGDLMWPETGSRGHVVQSLYRLTVRVPWYKTGKEIMDEWRAAHPDQSIDFDPGGLFQNLFLKYPGWRAREGWQQPALGIPGIDPCPPACSGEVTRGYEPKRP
jgi:YHS domain-containing protein